MDLYLFKVWYWQQLFQFGEEVTEKLFQCCVKVGPIRHRKHILSGEKLLLNTLTYLYLD